VWQVLWVACVGVPFGGGSAMCMRDEVGGLLSGTIWRGYGRVGVKRRFRVGMRAPLRRF
jgi:hypothetical protein